MYKKKNTVYIKAMTPIHAGCGQSLTSVDMPIQRESHSNIPKIEGSSLKGSIKHGIYHKNKFNAENIKIDKKIDYKKFEEVFGPEEDGDKNSSAISITDAKLLFFPMRSATDIYKLITCPYVLRRWQEECSEKLDLTELDKIENGECIVSEGAKSFIDGKVMLEEYIFDVLTEKNWDNILSEFLNAEEDKKRIVVLSDSDFIDMVTMYTEVITRNKISLETGTAEKSGLFSEEYLPAESILYFSVMESAFYKEDGALDYFHDNIGEIFQVGGNETIGKGIVKIIKSEK
jgi:CRISPR-associated protein Cmr4